MIDYLCTYFILLARSHIQLGPFFKMLLHNSSEEKREKNQFLPPIMFVCLFSIQDG